MSVRYQDAVCFCARCAARREHVGDKAQRVCTECLFGMVLEASGDLAPTRHEAFVVVDGGMGVGAVSERAEVLLGWTEAELIGSPIERLLSVEGVDDDAVGNGLSATLADAVIVSADALGAPQQMSFRSTASSRVVFHARVGVCGPPSAALVVLAAPR